MKITKFMKGNWKYAVLAPICIGIDTIGSITVPYFTSLIIDNVLLIVT